MSSFLIFPSFSSHDPNVTFTSNLGDAWKVLIDAAGAMMPNNDQETLISVTKFVDQLPSVFNEVFGYLCYMSERPH